MTRKPFCSIKDSDISGITPDRWVRAFKVGLEVVMKHGNAQPGDRTFVSNKFHDNLCAKTLPNFTLSL